MVSEVSKSISGELGKLPLGHPDRVFLRKEQSRFARYLVVPKEIPMAREDLLLVEAQARINKMVQEYNLAKSLSKTILNRNIQMQEESPEDSAVHLLPAEWRGFAGTVNWLRRSRIQTKKELMDTPSSLIIGKGSRKILGMGAKKIPFVLAMRDLAIAEKRII